MIDILTELFTKFNEYASRNQVIAGAVSLWGLTVLSYFARNIPLKIWNVVKKQTTTKLTLISTHNSFHFFLKWLIKNNYIKNLRSLKITNGKWGDDDSVKSIGYGVHYFMHKLHPFKIDVESKESSYSNMERDQITITVLGRSQKFFQRIFDEIEEEIKSKNELNICKFVDYWSRAPSQYKRNIDSVFIDKEIKTNVISHIKEFVENEEWYKDNGVPYQTGILLYGPPGTGKTSFIKAIASYFDRDVYILPASKLLKIEEAVMKLPSNAIMIIEDIDTDINTLSRESNDEPETAKTAKSVNESKPIKKGKTKENWLVSFSSIGDILNSIDGLITCNGRILIGTTNHKKKLSKALLRDGRFDLKVRLGNVNKDILSQFFKNYYPDFVIGDINIKDNISPAKLQNLIIKNLGNPQNVIDQISI